MVKKIIFLLFTFFLLENIHSATTRLRISSFTRIINLNYDLNGGAEIVQTLTLKHKGDAVNYFLTFSSGNSGQWSNRQVSKNSSVLSYQVYSDSSKINILKDLADNPSANEIISGSFAASGSFQFETITYTIYVPIGQFDIAGIYNDTFDVTLYSGDLSSYIQKASKRHRVKVTMPASLELSVTQTGIPFDDSSTSIDMNFGVLQSGSSRSADAVVRTNAPYSVFVLSDNQGTLNHSNPSVPDQVPYTFSFDGVLTDLSATTPVQVITGAAVTPWEGTRYPIEVTINDFGMASEGFYSDSITITIQAQ